APSRRPAAAGCLGWRACHRARASLLLPPHRDDRGAAPDNEQDTCRERGAVCGTDPALQAVDAPVVAAPKPTENTEEDPMAEMEKSIEVNAPLREVYNQWTQFEDFPRFMEGVVEVRQIDDKRLFWRADIGGRNNAGDARTCD